jgi:hypothetical protein
MKILSRIALVVCCFCYFLFPLSTTQASAATTREPKVYVTSYGDCYHNESCQYLYNSKRAIGKYKAQSLGYYACSVCKGTPSGTIAVYYPDDNSSRESSSSKYHSNQYSNNDYDDSSTTELIFTVILSLGAVVLIISIIKELIKKNKEK